MEYYSAIKKYEILPFATTWMDLEGLWYVKLKNTEKDKYSVITYMGNQKIKINECNKIET